MHWGAGEFLDSHLASWYQASLALLDPTGRVAPGGAGMGAADSRGPSGGLLGLRQQTHIASQMIYYLRDLVCWVLSVLLSD